MFCKESKFAIVPDIIEIWYPIFSRISLLNRFYYSYVRMYTYIHIYSIYMCIHVLSFLKRNSKSIFLLHFIQSFRKYKNIRYNFQEIECISRSLRLTTRKIIKNKNNTIYVCSWILYFCFYIELCFWIDNCAQVILNSSICFSDSFICEI